MTDYQIRFLAQAIVRDELHRAYMANLRDLKRFAQKARRQQKQQQEAA